MSDRIPSLLGMLERGQDSALLRFSLGSEYLARNEFSNACLHLRAAVTADAEYSAAWKLLGKALVGDGQETLAREAFKAGIDAATKKGDRQAAKEMSVFLRRLEAAAK
jgi:Tfp pilus assembly protein PilF